MNKKTILFVFLVLINNIIFAQNDTIKKIYSRYFCELSMQYNTVKPSDNTINGIRTTYVTNFFENTHFDFTNKFGVIVGFGIKNLGIKTKNETIDSNSYSKIIRRGLYGNASIALKYGDFTKHIFLFSGLGYDYGFHYRQKLYTSMFNSTKQGEWFSDALQKNMPHAFIGFQFSNGLNVRIIEYFNNFFNQNYSGVFGNFSNFKLTKLYSLSLSMQINENSSTKTINERIKEPINL